MFAIAALLPWRETRPGSEKDYWKKVRVLITQRPVVLCCMPRAWGSEDEPVYLWICGTCETFRAAHHRGREESFGCHSTRRVVCPHCKVPRYF